MIFREMCKSKIHRLTVTDARVDYEGSITIDEILLKKADILPYEKVQVANVTNGNRLDTYALPGIPGSGEVCMNGAAAKLCGVGDIIIVITYSNVDTESMKTFQPTVVHVDANNQIKL